ncbi:hypothetical protein FRX31_012423 [Thalictrum thalictroides]|uniref:Secreted protein n=1 Tax=Thalictrum thalictroides TaxID=46969 RepID=A0A7J6WLY3_THATH|nr:hypothetical protein FRX31_012423 [Thalictrum thalictroides]
MWGLLGLVTTQTLLHSHQSVVVMAAEEENVIFSLFKDDPFVFESRKGKQKEENVFQSIVLCHHHLCLGWYGNGVFDV